MFGLMTKKWYDLSPLLDKTFENLGLDTANWIVLALFVVLMLVVDSQHEKGVQIREKIASQNIIFRWIIYYGAILAILIFGMYGPEYNGAGFIYEQF